MSVIDHEHMLLLFTIIIFISKNSDLYTSFMYLSFLPIHVYFFLYYIQN